ncbi:hypothetical protein C4565_10065 [Candidatus Parcubacteria bacterium]|nr:MAG: hypothetical protein C4565_10065 [Candidatus Parcubacteria bacterium]
MDKMTTVNSMSPQFTLYKSEDPSIVYRHTGYEINGRGNKYTIKVACPNNPQFLEASYNSILDNGGKDTESSRFKAREVNALWQISIASQNNHLTAIGELHLWADQGGQHFNFLCLFINDAKGILTDDTAQNMMDKCPIPLPQRLNLLSSIIAFLGKRSDVQDRLNSNTYPELVETYFTLATLPNAHAPDAARHKAELCMDDGFHDWFAQKDHNREAMLRNAVNHLREPYKEGSPHEPSWLPDMLDRARNKFLRWYNLKDAASIIYPDSNPHRFLLLWLPEILASVLIAGLFANRFVPWLDWLVQLILYLLYFLPVLGCSLTLIRRFRESKINISLRIFLPRLAAAITVGYFVLMNNEAWQGAYCDPCMHLDHLLSWPPIWNVLLKASARTIVPLVAVFLYIYYMISKIPGIQMSGRRTGKAFFRGLSYAVLIGMPMSDIFGKIMLEDMWSKTAGIEGVIGQIIPEMILYLAPLALFIGFFLQLLWEDKSLTDEI